ncbi:MAG: hypothetical protein QQN41_04715 [Nitrosopumilus sp.]
MINELRKPEFYPSVSQSKEELVNIGKDAIPRLIELIKDTSFVKLKNTADLIYPGATEFYGHGYIIDYDIDWVSVRAGWVLEELTFEDFGFKQNQIKEDDLFKLIKSNYQSEYLEKGTYSVNFQDTTEIGKLKEYRKQLAIKVEKWWGENKDSWNRFEAIKLALNSNNSSRQHKALHYLRFEKTNCEGLTKESYNNELKSLVKIVKTKGKNGAEVQAKLLLQDKEYYWLKSKIKK